MIKVHKNDSGYWVYHGELQKGLNLLTKELNKARAWGIPIKDVSIVQDIDNICKKCDRNGFDPLYPIYINYNSLLELNKIWRKYKK